MNLQDYKAQQEQFDSEIKDLSVKQREIEAEIKNQYELKKQLNDDFAQETCSLQSG